MFYTLNNLKVFTVTIQIDFIREFMLKRMATKKQKILDKRNISI